jgi:Raf kinase inhibitor-like YbhB/YbcL family protein
MNGAYQGGTAMEEMRLTSPAFSNQGRIPAKYTCDGEDVNPPLQIENVPAAARSLALVMDDPDAPHGLFIHWTLWNINPRLTSIEEHAEPRETVCGKNSWGHNRYGGPCPPSGTHHYEFRLYALDTTLDLSGNASRDQLEDAMDQHILAVALLTGLYAKKGS